VIESNTKRSYFFEVLGAETYDTFDLREALDAGFKSCLVREIIKCIFG
jgi:hypothetical protein